MESEPHNARTDRADAQVRDSGLFDADWYAEMHSEACGSWDPLEHFCRQGWQQGYWPNPYFDTAWYAKTYSAEFLPGENPLLHYIRRGERENAWPSPHFDPEWYRDAYAIGGESPLKHYLQNRRTGTLSPLPVFDVGAYIAAHPECLAGAQDPYLHSLRAPGRAAEAPPPSASPYAALVERLGGNLEAGNIPQTVTWETLQDALRLLIPHLPFDEVWYCQCYPDVAAAVKCRLIASAHEHFVGYGYFEGRSPVSPSHEGS